MDEIIANKVKRYEHFPGTIVDRRAFLKDVYGPEYRGRDVDSMKEKQLYAVAKRLYDAGHAFEPVDRSRFPLKFYIDDAAKNREVVLREMFPEEEDISAEELEDRIIND